MSDDGDDTDDNTTDDPTVTSITASSSLEVTKTAAVTDNGDGNTGTSDIINYLFFKYGISMGNTRSKNSRKDQR